MLPNQPIHIAGSPAPEDFPPGYLEAYNGNQLVAATTAILVVATILLVLRIYGRGLKPGSRGWDDVLLPPSWLLFVALCVLMYSKVDQLF